MSTYIHTYGQRLTPTVIAPTCVYLYVYACMYMYIGVVCSVVTCPNSDTNTSVEHLNNNNHCIHTYMFGCEGESSKLKRMHTYIQIHTYMLHTYIRTCSTTKSMASTMFGCEGESSKLERMMFLSTRPGMNWYMGVIIPLCVCMFVYVY